MKKAFIDSDVILDALANRTKFAKPALQLFDLAFENKFEALTTTVVFINVNYFLQKLAPQNRLESMKRLRKLVTILPVDSYIIDSALESNFKDFEDAVQYFSATKANCEFIITRNYRDYKTSKISVLSAEEFIQII